MLGLVGTPETAAYPKKDIMGLPNPMSSRRKAFLASSTTLAVLSALLIAAPPAAADTAPPLPTVPATVSTDALPAPQINGVVWDQEIVGNTVYVAGEFTTARPAGSAPGANQVTRTHLLSFNLTTGALLPWAPAVNAQVRQLAVSPDGSRVYAVGDFTSVNNVTKNRIAAFSTASGALVTSFAASANNRIHAVVATNSTVYLGGHFSSVNGQTRMLTAAVSAATGLPTEWQPVISDGRAYAMVISPDESKVVLGGDFTTLNGSGNPGYGLGAVDATTGASLPWAVNSTIRNGGIEAAIYSLDSDGDSVYGTGYVFGRGGNLEGTFRADWANGALTWVEDCHGDTYSVAASNDVIYLAGHSHYCGNVDGFPQTDPWTFYRGLAFSKDATQTITREPYGYYNFAGTPAPSLLNWFPNMNIGSYTGQFQGPWTVEASGNYVVYGGEFTTVNGTPQQGIVRFASKEIAPNLDGPRLTGDNLMPTLQSTDAGSMTVSWPANHDRDNESLTYYVYRDGRTATPAYTTTVNSRFYDRPTISWVDSGLTPGQTYSYRVRAVDPFGNSGWGTTVSATVATEGTSSDYAKAVIADQPTNYWRLGDAAGPVVKDTVGRSNGNAGGQVTFGAAGAIIGDSNTAAAFSGTNTSSLVVSRGNLSTDTFTPVATDNTFSVETWIKTTATGGGKIVGFGTATSGNSSNYDRHVYMNAAGNLLFGVYPGTSKIVQSPKRYNDGQWHHVVATLGGQGMQLYVDGKRVAVDPATTSGQTYWGHWRIGGDNTWSGNRYIPGSIDETAVYPGVLTHAQILNHYTLSGRTANIPVAPADAYGAAVFANDPLFYYRLGETAGPAAVDSGSQENPGAYAGTYALGTTGAVKGTSNTAARFTNGSVASNSTVTNPTTYSTEIWFKTETTRGGKITGFGNRQSGLSNNYDRHVYMQDDGRLVFGTYTNFENKITSVDSYNDGEWHLATATQSSAGMRLYVDGELVGSHSQTSAQNYTGYWRAGGDTTWGSSNAYFDGSLDEFAVYQTALSASAVAARYELGAPEPVNVPPTADFGSTVAGKVVTVDAAASADSDGTIVSYEWNFGDGTPAVTATTATAQHTYATAGNYTVSLTVVDDDGAVGTTSEVVEIVRVNEAPTALFTEAATNLSVEFDASATTDADGTIASYAWNFGDGSTGSGVNPTHVYAAGGTVTVTLVVTDNEGATATVSHDITVSPANVAPSASFTSSPSGLTVNLDASASADPDGTIAGYDWDFGDGTPHATTVAASHTYAVAGDYTVTLIVTDNDGASATTSQVVTVTRPNGAPTASFTTNATGLSVAVDASASTDDGSIAGYAWTFGDGGTGTGVTASHPYAAAGDYTITLTVTDNAGLTGTTTRVVTVATTPTVTTLAEDRFTRTATSSWGSAPTGGPWTLSSAANSSVNGSTGLLSHTAGATRTARLAGISATDVDISVDISANKAMTGGGAYAGVIVRQVGTDYYQGRARFLANGTLAVQILQGGSTVLANATVPGTYTPGTALTIRVQAEGTSPTTIRAKLWLAGTAEPATWGVTATSTAAALQAAGSIGVVSYASGSITNAPLAFGYDNFVATAGTAPVVPPGNAAPTASFTATVSNLTASVNGGGSTDGDGTIVAYSWNWGDGTAPGTGVTASHPYAVAGTYTVTLTVTDDDGATGTTTGTVTVTAPPVDPPPVDPAAPVASDDFERTATAGWGVATLGGAWTTSSNANSAVNAGSGALTHAAGSTRRAMLNSMSVLDIEQQVVITTDKPVVTGQIVAGLVGRQVGTDFYQGRVRLLPDGVVALQLVRGSANILAFGTIPGLSYTPGDKLVLKVRITGASPTTIQAKVWKLGETEPAAWQSTATDSTAALQVAAPIGIESYISGSAPNGPVVIRYDDYVARPPQ
jgi:PKD repeat protein